MTSHINDHWCTVAALGDEERALVRLAAVIAAGSEADIRTELARALAGRACRVDRGGHPAVVPVRRFSANPQRDA